MLKEGQLLPSAVDGQEREASLIAGASRRSSRSRGVRKRASLGWRSLLYGGLPLVGFVLVWHLATTVWLDAPRIYPPPTLVLEEAVRIFSGESAVVGTSYEHLFATLRRLATAFVIAMVTGTLIGVAAGRKKVVFDLIDSALWVFMSIPSVVWAFVLVVAIGISESVPVLALLGILGPVVTLQIAEGTRSMPSNLLELADSYKVRGVDRLRHLFIPYLVPYLAGSARVAFALGIRIIVVAEVVGLSRGIGFEMNYWYSTLVLAPLVAWSLILASIGLLVDNTVFKPLEKRATRWRDEELEDLSEGPQAAVV